MPAKPLPAEDLEAVLVQTAPLWEEARGRRFFITGGTGFFGSWLVETFCHINRRLGLNATVVILTRNAERFAAKCPHLMNELFLEFQAGDVRSFAFPDGPFDYVLHAATDTSAKVAAESPDEIFSTIVDGTRRVLQFAEARGVGKFLLTSSGAVYGKQPPELTHVPETYSGAPDVLDPASSYAEGKRSAELLCALHSQRGTLECKIARCWAFCGPHLPLDQHFAIGNFIGDALAKRPIKIRGDGTARRSYLYAADLAAWLWAILFRAPKLRPYNVGGESDVSILELARKTVTVLGSELPIDVLEDPQPGSLPARYVPDISRAQRELGLRPTIDLPEMIVRTARWYSE
jgi:dTDP-glucose 4,6-dehydratase